MTLNNVINRLKTISLAHRQVRTFQAGLVSDFLNDHTTKYPAVFLQDIGGSISTTGHATTLNYKFFIMDLVNVAEDTKTNEQDVQSDMVSIAMDLLAQMNSSNYEDWRLSPDNNLQLVVENDSDMHAGCIIDFSISFMFKQDLCAIPSDLVITTTDDMDSKVYDLIYTSDGTEVSTLTLSALLGKKIILITRESSPIYKVSSNPDPAEFTWNNTSIGLGTEVNPDGGERFLILYRNY